MFFCVRFVLVDGTCGRPDGVVPAPLVLQQRGNVTSAYPAVFLWVPRGFGMCWELMALCAIQCLNRRGGFRYVYSFDTRTCVPRITQRLCSEGTPARFHLRPRCFRAPACTNDCPAIPLFFLFVDDELTPRGISVPFSLGLLSLRPCRVSPRKPTSDARRVFCGLPCGVVAGAGGVSGGGRGLDQCRVYFVR